MIPSEISREHVLKVISDIDAHVVPKHHVSKKYGLLHEGRKYPPKYVISRANRYANGYELASHTFGGGRETNGYLRSLGFTIIESSTVKAPPNIRRLRKTLSRQSRHNEAHPLRFIEESRS